MLVPVRRCVLRGIHGCTAQGSSGADPQQDDGSAIDGGEEVSRSHADQHVAGEDHEEPPGGLHPAQTVDGLRAGRGSRIRAPVAKYRGLDGAQTKDDHQHEEDATPKVKSTGGQGLDLDASRIQCGAIRQPKAHGDIARLPDARPAEQEPPKLAGFFRALEDERHRLFPDRVGVGDRRPVDEEDELAYALRRHRRRLEADDIERHHVLELSFVFGRLLRVAANILGQRHDDIGSFHLVDLACTSCHGGCSDQRHRAGSNLSAIEPETPTPGSLCKRFDDRAAPRRAATSGLSRPAEDD